MKAVLLMAHGAPRDLDEVEEYVLRIRHGRPLAPDLMATIRDRYRQIGGSPLLERTQSQAQALQERLNGTEIKRVYIGMRYSTPYIRETIAQMIRDGVTSIVGVCLAPQFSTMTIGAYQKALDEAIESHGVSLPYQLVRTYATNPGLIRAFASRLDEGRHLHPEASVLFTAHSLPVRVLLTADPYDFEVKETARLVALRVQLKDWRFAYQSQGLTPEPWLRPAVESRLDELAKQSVKEVLVVPIGFVCDHVEILYDVDIQYREYAERIGMKLYRSQSLNDSSEFIDLLTTLVNERL